MTFSRRLSSTTAIIIYTALIVGFAPSVIRHHQIDGSLVGTLLMTAAILMFGLNATFGWRWCMQREQPSWVNAYFVTMTLLVMSMFWLENVDTMNGAGVGNLLVVLLLQSGVLSLRAKLALHFSAALSMVTLSALFVPLDRILLPSLVVLLTNGAVVLIGHLLVRDEQTQTALEAANRKLTEYAVQVDELATMRERNRLAREIHDNLGHYLTVINTQIEAACTILDSDPERSVYLLERAQSLTKEGLSEIRRSVAALRSSPIEQHSLPDAIRSLLTQHNAAGVTIAYQVEGETTPLPESIEHVLYRAAQEGLTNLHKHAHATSAELRLIFQQKCVSLHLRDDGIGSANPSSGFGLLGLQERVKLIGGRFSVQTSPGNGFLLDIEVPI